jgi:hypothetical protein
VPTALRQKLALVIPCPNIAFQIVLGHLQKAVHEISEASTTMETAKSTRKIRLISQRHWQGGFSRSFPKVDDG